MSQLPLAQDAVAEDLEASAEELIRRGSREGAHLSRMLDQLATEGQSARAVVRHGLVRDEIIAEARRAGTTCWSSVLPTSGKSRVFSWGGCPTRWPTAPPVRC